MPRMYIVRQGDHLASIALRYGLDANALWADDANAELRSRRSNPDHLTPGDILRLPDRPLRGAPLASGSVNRYKATIPRAQVKLVLRQRGAHGEPELVANAACLVHGVAAAPVPASTNERGELAVEVPVDLRELEVEVHSTGLRLLLLLGHIDSIEEPSGIRQRLAHLDYHPVGFEAGEGRLVDAFDRWAIRSFQQAEGLTVTGEADDATRARLRERFGG